MSHIYPPSEDCFREIHDLCYGLVTDWDTAASRACSCPCHLEKVLTSLPAQRGPST